MEQVVKTEVRLVFDRVLELFAQNHIDTIELKEVSRQTVRHASLFQDEDTVSVAILVYSLSKIVERRGDKVNLVMIRNLIACAVQAIDSSKPEEYRKCIHKLFNFISSEDAKFRHYVQEVIGQARIKKGSEIVAQGISAARTAELLGISLWELHDYISATRIGEDDVDISAVRDRLKFTRSLFR